VTGRESRLPLTIHAEGLPPRLQLSLDTLDAGRIFTKTSHSYEVVLANRGLIPAVFNVRRADTVFGQFIDVQPSSGRMEVDSYQALLVSLNADRMGSFEELIKIEVEGSPQDVVMKLRFSPMFCNVVLIWLK